MVELPSLETITFGKYAFGNCQSAVFESKSCLYVYAFARLLIIIDLPKLHTIYYDKRSLAGDSRTHCKTTINGKASFRNQLIMKSMNSVNKHDVL